MRKFSFVLAPILIFIKYAHSQNEYQNSEVNILTDENGMDLPFIILHENAPSLGFDLETIDNPFLKGDGFGEIGDFRTHKSVSFSNGVLSGNQTITNSIVSDLSSGKNVRSETYNHLGSFSMVEELPFEKDKPISEIIEDFDHQSLINSFLDGFSSSSDGNGIDPPVLSWESSGAENLLEVFTDPQIGSHTISQLSLLGHGNFSQWVPIDEFNEALWNAPIIIDLSVSVAYSGVKPIKTQWGVKDAYLLTTSMFVDLELSTSHIDLSAFVDPANQSTSMKINELSYGVTSFMNQYFIEGFGVYQVNSIMKVENFPTSIVMEYENKTITSELPPYLGETDRKDQSYLIDGNFDEIFQEQEDLVIPESPQLNSWTWNGAFPWVYDHASKSWFYYYFGQGGYHAYDSNSGRWLTFDAFSESWTFAQ